MNYKPNSKAVAVNLRVVKEIPWIWAAVGTFVMWVVLGLFARNLSLESLIATSTNASFLAIVALGQMLVITTGGGAIDLSIPNVITLSAFLSAGIASGSNLKALYAVPVVLVTGALIGLVNAFTVLFLRIAPIIATLGTGYIITTAILIYNPHFSRTGRPLPASDGGERRGRGDAHFWGKGSPAGDALRQSLPGAPGNRDAGSGFEHRRSARR